MESELKKLENHLDSNSLRKYDSLKNDLEIINNHIAKSIRIRSKCDWYEQDKKSTKKNLNLEKQCNQNRIRKPIANKKEIKRESEISNQINFFFGTLSRNSSQKCQAGIDLFLNTIDIPKFSKEQVSFCDIETTEKDLLECMKGMENDKSPGNDGLSKEFYETFWEQTFIKETFISSIRKAEEKKELSISHIDSDN